MGMGKSYSALTLAAAASAVAALGVLGHWVLAQPVASPADNAPTAFFLEPLVAALQDPGDIARWFRAAFLGMTAATGILGAALALTLLLKAEPTPANRHLAAALGLAAWTGAYFVFVATHGAYLDLLGWHRGLAWQYGWHFAGCLAGLLAPYFLARFFFAYPTQPIEEQWREHFAAMARDDRAQLARGWRRHVYRKSAGATEGRAITGAVMHHFVRSGRIVPVLVILALLSAVIDIPAPGVPAPSTLFRSIAAVLSVSAVSVTLTTAFEALNYHRRNALPLDRARIDWIWGTTLVAGLLCVAVMPVWWALLPFLLPALESRAIVVPGHVVGLGPWVLAMQAAFLAFVVSLALSVFYRGAVDPRLAARKITLIGLLGLIVAAVFVLVERAVAVKLAAWLDLPPETGLVAAGAIVGVSFQPLRRQVERWVDAFVTRFLPLDSLVSGERKTQAVVMADLSGYTALSARDEKQAHLLAALLQKIAKKTCAARRGRLVKSMGDAVMLAFDQPGDAVAVLEQLHAEFEPAAEALGLEKLRVHSGGHVGEVTQTVDGDLYGQTVNITARLQGLASAGECVISGALADAAAITDGRRRDLGPQRLKNVPEPVVSVSLRLAGAPA
jgi:class 3 adenylate cyclase